LLFTTIPDGKPIEFHMTPCPQKQVLQPLIEVGRLFGVCENAERGLRGKSGSLRGKSSESIQCAITGPCLRMRHRPSA